LAYSSHLRTWCRHVVSVNYYYYYYYYLLLLLLLLLRV